MTDDRNPSQPHQPLLLETDAIGRKPQQRWVDAAARRAEVRAHFEALPESLRTATIAHLDRLLRDAHWRFATTMPQNPHEYTHTRTWNRVAFTFAVEYIRFLGVRERYDGRIYTVYFSGGYKHWTMNWPTSQTILINRKPVAVETDR